MDEAIRARPGELTADDVVDALDSGRRVLITVEVVGTEKQVAFGAVATSTTATRRRRSTPTTPSRGSGRVWRARATCAPRGARISRSSPKGRA